MSEPRRFYQFGVLAFLLSVLVLVIFVLPRCLPATRRHGASPTRTMLETHYSPEENLERIDLANLGEAHTSIELFGYSLTDGAIIATLKDVALHGTIVSVYLDNEQTADELRRPGLRDALLDLATTQNVRVLVKRSRILQHTKAYVVDTRLLREGSANFSPSALKQQDNDLLMTDDQDAISSFELSYRVAWERPDNIPLSEFAR
jgi:phosphatidylserine/phosphatidylglycerophosphate/cardiolipin synthase-like enzyme